MMSKFFYKLCVAVFILVLIICRIFLKDENLIWIGFISCLGVIVALVDLYNAVHNICIKNNNNKSYTVIGSFVVAMIFGIVLLALSFTGIIVINNKWNDILSLITLLITLPQDFYCDIIKEYIKK